MVSGNIGLCDLRIRIAIAALAILSLVDLASAEPYEEWNKSFWEMGATTSFHDIRQTSDGGYIAVGVIQTGEIVEGTAWVMKMDERGNEQWNRTFGDKMTYDIFLSVQQTTDGGYIIAGYTNSYFPQFYPWILKMDADGNEQWNKTFRDKIPGSAHFVQQTKDGGFIIAGDKYPINKDIWVVKTWLIKTDGNGNVIWDETFGEGRTQKSVQTSDGGYIILSGKSYHIESEPFGRGYAWLIKVGEKAVPASVASQANQGEIPVSIPKEKLDGFEAVFSIAIILAACIAGRKMK